MSYFWSAVPVGRMEPNSYNTKSLFRSKRDKFSPQKMQQYLAYYSIMGKCLSSSLLTYLLTQHDNKRHFHGADPCGWYHASRTTRSFHFLPQLLSFCKKNIVLTSCVFFSFPLSFYLKAL